jgi:hypothetical protein
VAEHFKAPIVAGAVPETSAIAAPPAGVVFPEVEEREVVAVAAEREEAEVEEAPEAEEVVEAVGDGGKASTGFQVSV